jgi:hypothetical protein
VNEASVTSVLLSVLRHRLPGFVVLKHNDAKTAGIPDISVTGRGLTTWLEIKVGETIESRMMQQIMLQRLFVASRGGAFYVLYRSDGVVISQPTFRDVSPSITVSQTRMDHQFVLQFLIARHRC